MLTTSEVFGDTATMDLHLDEVFRLLTEKSRGSIRRDESMAIHTTFRVGGPADLFIVPEDEEDLQLILAVLAEYAVPLKLLGNGSNVLVADRGIRGAVIRLTPQFAQIVREGHTLQIGAGAKLARVVQAALTEGLSGLESTMGIPGTIGGALVMNAGTDSGSISDLVEMTTCLTPNGEQVVFTGDQLSYGYRQSALQGSHFIVLSTRLSLHPGDQDTIHAKMTRLEEKRTSRQPTRCHTAGSTFKNPHDIAAGKLLDRAGCKGYRIGGAEVSGLHANFIIAQPGATATDIRQLALWMQQCVFEQFEYALEMEIELLGEWTGWDAFAAPEHT